MSEVSARTPKRQAIVERLRQRIDSFRKHHDSCQARLEETQPSRELKLEEETRFIKTRILENKIKMNAKIRPDQVGKIAKLEEITNVAGPEKAASNTGLQPNAKRRAEFPSVQMDGERSLQSSDDLTAPVPPKYQRFENPNDVHCNVKPPNFNVEGDPSLPLSTKMGFPTVNGHNGDFPKSEDQSKVVSSYSGTMCDNIDRTMSNASQQFAKDFASSTFANRGQSGVSDNSRTPDFPVNFKQENGLVSPGNDVSTSMANGFPGSCTKSEDEYGSRLLTDYGTSKSSEDNLRQLDLKSQLSQFERVLQDIKNRKENPGDCESKNDVIPTQKQSVQSQNRALGNGLSDSVSHDIGKGGNQLGLSNAPNNGTQLSAAPVTSSTQQHGISRSTAEALQQFVIAQQEGKLNASKVRFERELFLNSQGIGGEQNVPRMPQRPNHYPRQRIFEQIQRRTNQQKSRMLGPQTPSLHARNPGLNPLGPSMPYQMHPKVRYPNIPANTPQPVTFSPGARVQQSLISQMHQTSTMQQPQHQMNVIAQQQKMAFQQQMASRLPSYSQAQRLPHSSSIMDIRQKFHGGGHTSQSGQYAVAQQVSRAPQPLSHLQHYPTAYSSQGGSPSRPMQTAYSAQEYSGYQHAYTYSANQDNKLPVYQRHASMNDNLSAARYRSQDLNRRNNLAYQRSSSLPGHSGGAKNLFNQSSPPVVRLGQGKPNLPDMNNNGNEPQSQEMGHLQAQPPLTHMKQQHISQTSSLTANPEHFYQGGAVLAQSRPQTSGNLQPNFSNSLSNLLDLKSSSESSLFPFFGQEIGGGGSTDSADFDSLLKSPPPDFDLLNILENDPQKTLQ